MITVIELVIKQKTVTVISGAIIATMVRTMNICVEKSIPMMVEPPREEVPMQLIVIEEPLTEGDTLIGVEEVLRMVTVEVTQLVEVDPTNVEDQTTGATSSQATEVEGTEVLVANPMELQPMWNSTQDLRMSTIYHT